MGFSLSLSEAGNPFNCENCTNKDKANRNCNNYLNLSEDAKAVKSYTEDVKKEHQEKGAKKVFPGSIRLYECPLTYISRDTHELIRLIYLIEDSKVLLHPGGWANQPYWLIESLELYRIQYMKAKKKKA